MDSNLGEVVLVKDINPNNGDGFPFGYAVDPSSNSFTKFNNKLYFGANDGENGNELWVSDGTAEGTQLLVDINSGSADSEPQNLT